MILNNKVSQRLEIIGFKGSVKKSTSRIQVIYNICLQFFVVFSETAKIEKHVAENGMSSNNVKRSHL